MNTPLRSTRNVTYRCAYHGVWRPTYRRQVLVPPSDARRTDIVALVRDDVRHDLVEGEVMSAPDHLLEGCDPRCGACRFVARIKGVSRRLSHQDYPALTSRLPSRWTDHSSVATTGGAPLARVKRSMETQQRSER